MEEGGLTENLTVAVLYEEEDRELVVLWWMVGANRHAMTFQIQGKTADVLTVARASRRPSAVSVIEAEMYDSLAERA